MQSKKIWNENLSNKLSFAENIGPVKDEIIKFKKLSNIIHTTNMAHSFYKYCCSRDFIS